MSRRSNRMPKKTMTRIWVAEFRMTFQDLFKKTTSHENGCKDNDNAEDLEKCDRTLCNCQIHINLNVQWSNKYIELISNY